MGGGRALGLRIRAKGQGHIFDVAHERVREDCGHADTTGGGRGVGVGGGRASGLRGGREGEALGLQIRTKGQGHIFTKARERAREDCTHADTTGGGHWSSTYILLGFGWTSVERAD